MHVVYPLVVSALLFSIGVYGVLARRNTILVLMSVEIMLNAVNLNLVVFDVWLRDRLHSGQVLTLFVIVIAAAEVGLGLAIVLALYRNRQTIDLDRLRSLSEPTEPEPTDPGATNPGPVDPGPDGIQPTGPGSAAPAGAALSGEAGAHSPPRTQNPAETRGHTLAATRTRQSRFPAGSETDPRPGDAS
nr:NADH-quinone oxidoreductase subunit NuoK [Streptosporangium amethystogenes]